MKSTFFISFLAWCLVGTSLAAGESPTATVEAAAREFVTLLGHGEFQQASTGFDATMQAAVPSTQLQEIWVTQVQAHGAYDGIAATRTETVDAFRVVFVTCRFAERRLDVKVVYDVQDRIAGLFVVPPPATYCQPPYVDTETFRETAIEVGEDAWRLPGTLSRPVGEGPFPVVVLVHGSGPQDRDETIGPNQPLKDLAWGLASRGIAVLRYEKRTRHYAARIATASAEMTVKEETTDDALAAVALARRTTGLDPDRVFVLGHSLGGMLAPRLAQDDPRLAGLILLAANARPLEDLVLEQVIFQASLAPVPAVDAEAQVQAIKDQVARIKGLTAASVSHILLGAPTAYWLDLQGYAPATVARDLPQPLLILQGGKDCQVSPVRDFGEWQRALADRQDAILKTYPDLNHLFMAVAGTSTGQEYQAPGNVAEEVVRDIAAWIVRP